MRLTQVLPVVLASATVVVGAPTDKHRLIKRDPGCLRRGGVWTACLAVQALQVQIGGVRRIIRALLSCFYPSHS